MYTVNQPQALQGTPGEAHALVLFDSLTDTVRSGQQGSNSDSRRTSRQDANGGWFGTETFADACELAFNGWSEGTQRISNLAERISERVSRRVVAHGMDLWEEGGEVDVAAYLDGERACMWTWTEQDNKRPIVHVTVNVAASSHVTADEYTVAGAVAAALVDALESAGRRVELTVYCAIQMGSDPGRVVFGTQLKRAEEPTDLGAIAYALAHPSMLRRTLFSVMERTPAKWRNHFDFYSGRGYGRPGDVPDELHGDVHLELSGAARRTIDENYDWIMQQLANQGVDVSVE